MAKQKSETDLQITEAARATLERIAKWNGQASGGPGRAPTINVAFKVREDGALEILHDLAYLGADGASKLSDDLGQLVGDGAIVVLGAVNGSASYLEPVVVKTTRSRNPLG